ncbi:MAG: energy-coupling factor ABC transporter permease [Dehalococcoidales bacterium]|nr:energy-coupling factor ABC transporter permease [Dehalococcoidales bacterium]
MATIRERKYVMHIPDGFLNVSTIATTYIVAAGGVGNAVRITNKKLGEKHVPLMGVLAAFIFAAQMLNFPIAGGTSGHFLGAALAAILLGPWASVLIMSCVLIAQSLIFQDGGLLAMGANIFNMGIVASFSSYYFYRLFTSLVGDSKRGKLVGVFGAGWISVFLAAIACAIELAISGTSPMDVVLPAMAGIHAVIGIGEGLITTAVFSMVLATRADLLQLQRI